MPALAYRQAQSLSPAHQWFTDHLPELTSRAKALFHRLPYVEREDAVAEVLAFIFQYALRAFQRGVLDRLTPYTMVVFCGKNYASGRRFAGSSSLCPLSKQTQMERGVGVHSIEECRQEFSTEHHQIQAYRLADTLPADRNQDRPFDNTRREVDYPDILDREEIGPKTRRVFDYLLETNSNGQLVDLCQELRVTPGRTRRCSTRATHGSVVEGNKKGHGQHGAVHGQGRR